MHPSRASSVAHAPREGNGTRPLKLLLVDDDRAFSSLCSMALSQVGLEHVTVASAENALEALTVDAFDLVLLDMELPGMTGRQLLELLRARGRNIPIVFVSVIEDPQVKAQALELGADDYVAKPFDFDELLARLRSVLRRSRRGTAFQFGDLQIDPSLRKTLCRGRPVDLTPREFEVLWILAGVNGAVVTPMELIRRVWKLEPEQGKNALRVNVSRLKHKLARLSRVRVEAIQGQGYRLVDDVAGGGSRPSGF